MSNFYLIKPSNKQGFALVIALSLMAFMMLLLLSITTLVQVESQSSQVGRARVQAQQNALLGLQVALGELQKAAGPDQRVTVSSDMFDSDPSNLEIQDVTTRNYVGVFNAHHAVDPSDIESLEDFRISNNTPAQAQKWLASADDLLTDPIASGPASFSEETISVAKLYQADTDSVEDVIVGKVSINDGTGSYAWWIADEGMKAKFNVVDPGIGLTVTEGPFEQEKLDVMQTRQSSFAHVSDGFGLKFSDLLTSGDLSKSYSAQSFDLLSSDWGDWMLREDPSNTDVTADINADVTLFSRGLPVDVTQGRLKEDLTVYLETGEGLGDDDHIVRGSSQDSNYNGPDFGASLTGDPGNDNMPRFGLLRSWNELGKEYGDNGVAEHQPQTNTQHGLHPTVMRVGYSLSIAREGNLSTWAEDPNNSDNILAQFRIIAFVRVALMNPYNFKLPAEQYLLEVALPEELYLEWSTNGTIGHSLQPDNVELFSLLAGSSNNDGLPLDGNYTLFGDKPWLRMTLDTGHDLLAGGGGMFPGEVLNFTPEEAQDKLLDAVYQNLAADEFRANSFQNYMDPTDQDGVEDFTNLFVIGKKIEVSIPKPPSLGGSKNVYNIRYKADSSTAVNGIEHDMPWRLSLLSDSASQLLSTKDPTKMDDQALFANGFDMPNLGNVPSTNFTNIKQFGSNNNTHKLESQRTSAWLAPARSKNARYGGDRRNAIRNPRGGVLRDGMTVDDWGVDDHRTSVYVDDHYEALWRGDRWHRKSGVTGNVGTVEGFVNDSVGSSSSKTGTRYTFFDFPRRFGPITSLGQLQHANLNPFAFGSAYQVGFSRAPYHVGRGDLVENAATSLLNERIDLPFMVNASLWDRFYLSTIPQTGGLSLERSNLSVLANNRHVLTPSLDGSFPDEADLRDSAVGFEQSAANIQIDGAFNINSVSVDAWEAVLLQAAGKTIETEQDGILNNAGNESFVAFPRFPDPVYGVDSKSDFDSIGAQDAKQHAGMFVTDRADIRILAETIVAEVKRRGPFLSMADFINRRQLADSDDIDLDYQGLMGTLDAAIMRASQLDGVLNNNQITDLTGESQQNLNPNDPTASASKFNDPEAAFGVPLGHANTALEGNSANLIQGDILQQIGAQLTVRSDTFVIRSYGESTDPLTGEEIATARCEALVQRVAEPVDVNDSLVAPTGEFGRRFVVLALRWYDDES